MKKIISSSKEIIITYIIQILIIFIISYIYTFLGNKNLNNLVNQYCSIILLLFYIITIIYLYNKNKIPEPKLNQKYYPPLISIGIALSCLLNMLIFLIHKTTATQSISFLILSISSGIIGPTYEEILFRYLLLNRLKKFTTTKKAIIINTLIFAILHFNPIKIFYAFTLGLILNLTYQKYNNIKAPIIVHMSANTIALLLTDFNIYILIFSIIVLLLNKKYVI